MTVLDRLEALHRDAGQGTWKVGETTTDEWYGKYTKVEWEGDGFPVFTRDGATDAALIVAMHAALPGLLAVARAAAEFEAVAPNGLNIEVTGSGKVTPLRQYADALAALRVALASLTDGAE